MAGNENADFDLYAKWGSPPTTSSYDAIGYSGTSLEYFTTSGSGTLYIMVRSFSSSGNWKCWALSGSPGTSSGRKSGTLSGTGATATYSLSGSGKGYAFNSGPVGSDFDLYTKWNSPPTTSSYDACGYSSWRRGWQVLHQVLEHSALRYALIQEAGVCNSNTGILTEKDMGDKQSFKFFLLFSFLFIVRITKERWAKTAKRTKEVR